MRNAIFLAFDDGYMDYAKVCISSIVKNYPNYPEILIFYNGNNEENLKYFGKINRISIHSFDLEFLDYKRLNLNNNNSKLVFVRHLLWSERFKEYDNILYLDVDTLILKPLDELFSKEDFFAVYDLTPSGYSIFKNESFDDERLLKLLNEDGINISFDQFSMMNSGVFLIPRKYRTQKYFDKLIELTYKYNSYAYIPDQTSISLWCHYNKIEFSGDLVYNFQLCFFNHPILFFKKLSQADYLSDIHIMHYTWWKPENTFYNRFLNISKSFIDFDKVLSTYVNDLEGD